MVSSVRAFIALYPSEEVRDRLVGLQSELRGREWARGFKWTQPDNLHLTLLFLGNVASTSVERLTTALRTAAEDIPPMSVGCNGLGCFPNARRPTVLWAGLDGPPAFSDLHAAVLRECGRFAEKAEKKPFRPHLTLARAKWFDARFAAEFQADVDAHHSAASGTWNCASVSLVQSFLHSAGPEYRELARCPLAGKNTV
jgi:RNA 2',3'-cyclic 3'-phosphodiesterase